MKNSHLTSSNSFASSSLSSSKRPISGLSLNLQKSASYSSSQMSQHDLSSSQNYNHRDGAQTNLLDSSILSSVSSSLNQAKFQFDIYINKVELTVPSPVYIFVQVLKGTHSLNTKKKLKIDQANKMASFNEKLSIVTCLNKNTGQTLDQNHGEYMPKLIQVRLLAFYNSKEKAIGICSVDLSKFVHGQKDGKIAAKATFQKCFDKSATLSFEIRAKEQFNQIKESILEEHESSSVLDQDLTYFDTQIDQREMSHVQDSTRFSVLENPGFLTSNEEDQSEDSNSITNQKSAQKIIHDKTNISNNLQETSTSSSQKDNEGKYYEATLRSHRNAVVQKNNKVSPSKTLNSARTITNNSMSTQNLIMHPSQTSTIESNSNLGQSRSQTPNLKANQDSTNSNETTPSQSGDSINQIKRLEEKIRKFEYEVKSLKQENQDQKQKIVTLQIKEERMREYEVKCNEADSYRLKAQSLEQQLRKSAEEQQEFERERLIIIESYEKKIHDLKTQLQEQQSSYQEITNQNQHLQQQIASIQQYNTMNTVDSTQADEDTSKLQKLRSEDEFKIDPSDTNLYYRDLYEKLLIQMKQIADENSVLQKTNQNLEHQLIRSSEQMSQLVNELYSLEKENIYDSQRD